MSKQPAQDVKLDLDKELRDAQGRILEYELSIQRGEADDDEFTAERRVQLREQARKNLKGRSDVAEVIRYPQGRRMLYRILEIAGPNRLSPNVSDPGLTAEANGKRFVANAILEMLYDADPNVYAQMQREHVSDMKTEIERKTREMEATPS